MTAFHFLVCLAFLQHQNISLFSFLANQGKSSTHAVSHLKPAAPLTPLSLCCAFAVLASAVLTVALFSIIKEMLDIWANYGIILRSNVKTGGFLLRLTVKSGFALYLLLLYIWSFEERGVAGGDDPSWQRYLIVTAVYLTPFVCSDHIPRACDSMG